MYRLFCSNAEDELFVGDVTTKSPVLFHRFARPVGLPMPPLLCDMWWLLLILFILLILLLLVSCTGAAVGLGNGDAAGDELLCESAECNEPFDWWCSERRFKLVTFVVAWNLEGEFVVLFVLLPPLLSRQSSIVAVAAGVVICDDRTEMEIDIIYTLRNYHKNYYITFSTWQLNYYHVTSLPSLSKLLFMCVWLGLLQRYLFLYKKGTGVLTVRKIEGINFWNGNAFVIFATRIC